MIKIIIPEGTALSKSLSALALLGTHKPVRYDVTVSPEYEDEIKLKFEERNNHILCITYVPADLMREMLRIHE